MLFFRSAAGYEGVVSNGFCRGCLSGGASWPRLEVAHPPPDTNYCIASSASGCPIELSSCASLPPIVALHALPPPFCERTPGLRTIPRSQLFALDSTYASTRYVPIYVTISALPLGVAKGPIRYQNNSHLFVVRPTTPCPESP